MTEHVKTNDSVYFTANFYHPISGFSCSTDATPRWLVYESGATVILQGAMTARSTIVGSYWGTFIASAANGFDSNQFYDVQVSGIVDSIGGFSSIKQFVVDDIFAANVVQVSGQYVSGATTVDANIVQVSGQYVSINDFVGEASSLTAANIRIEMDANSLKLTAISGSVAGLAGAAMRGTDNAALATSLTAVSGSVFDANIVQVSGNPITPIGLVDVNVVQVSGNYVSIEDFQGEAGSLTAASVRVEMDTNSIMLSAISGQAITAAEVRTEMDANSLSLAAISGSVAGLAGASMRGTDNAALATNLNAVSGVIISRTIPSGEYGSSNLTAGDIRVEIDANSLMLSAISGNLLTNTDIYNQVSGVLVAYDVATGTDIYAIDSDVYFAAIKHVSDTTNDQDEFAVQWFKNDQPVGSGDLTSPRLSVYNTSNGLVLINGVSMNYASPNLGVVRYNTTMVLASGEPYLVETSGTIDGINRTWRVITGIDLL